MGQVSSADISNYEDVSSDVTREECDVTRIFPKAMFLKCQPNDAMFTYSVNLENTTGEHDIRKHVLVSKNSRHTDILKRAADLSRFGSCYNFLRYEKSFFCNSPKAMTKLGCKKFGDSAHFVVVSNYSSNTLDRLHSSIDYDTFLGIFFQLCYALRELNYSDINTAHVSLRSIGLKPIMGASTIVLPSGKMYSFEEGYFPILLNLDGKEEDIQTKFQHLKDECGSKFTDGRISSFLMEINSVDQVFKHRDVQKYEGINLVNVPIAFHIADDALPEPFLKPWFAVSSEYRESVAQVANRLVDKWVREVARVLQDIQSRPTSYDQFDILSIENQIRYAGHPDLTSVLSTLHKFETKSRVSSEEAQILKLVGVIDEYVYTPSFEGERLFALKYLVKLYNYIKKKGDPTLAKAASVFVDIYMLEKLTKEVYSEEPSPELRDSKLTYIQKVYKSLRSNKYVPKELIELLSPFSSYETETDNYPKYGSQTWKDMKQPREIKKIKRDSFRIGPTASLLLSYLSTVRVGQAVYDWRGPFSKRAETSRIDSLGLNDQQLIKIAENKINLAKAHREEVLAEAKWQAYLAKHRERYERMAEEYRQEELDRENMEKHRESRGMSPESYALEQKDLKLESNWQYYKADSLERLEAERLWENNWFGEELEKRMFDIRYRDAEQSSLLGREWERNPEFYAELWDERSRIFKEVRGNHDLSNTEYADRLARKLDELEEKYSSRWW